MNRIQLAAPLLLACVLAAPAAADPVTQRLDTGWRFAKGGLVGAERSEFDASRWESVTIPHSWNASDWADPAGYFRGTGWYRRTLDIPAAWKGQRVFLRFGAAGVAADVYVNGKAVGQHVGAFAAFGVELTSALQYGGANVLAVRVNNERRDDMPPLSGDFNVFGGLYRPVTLLVRDQTCVNVLDYGSPGVQVRQMAVSAERADLDVRTSVSNGAAADRDVQVVVRVLDAGGNELVTTEKRVTVPAGQALTVAQDLTVAAPHLWDGIRDPYLHTVVFELRAEGRTVDKVKQPVGLRSMWIDPEKGFFLNGRPYPLHGVDRHQDYEGAAWAVTETQQDEDMALLREIGANAVRLAHYQHGDYFYSLCDRMGLVVWAELPLVNAVNTWDEFAGNARQQLVELIRQNINHSSIAMWSVYNEVGLRTKVDPAPLVGLLHAVARAEDPTRPTVGAMHGAFGRFRETAAATSLLAVNFYPGWYSGTLADMGPWIDRWNRDYGNRGLAVSEYGAGASPNQHEQGMTKGPVTTGKWHPEEWQATYHEETYAAITARPFVWGSFVWAMFDFSSAGRTEGERNAVNDKGLVTYDRKTRKDAFHFYKANWNPEPMVYITSRRHVERAQAITDVKVYSNCPRVELKVNGTALAPTSPNAVRVFTWPGVRLVSGENVVEALCAGGPPRDAVRWVYTPAREGLR